MSAGAFTLFNKGKRKLIDQTVNIAGAHTLKAILCTNSVAFTAAFTGTSADCRYSDITSEITGTGYSAGGLTLTSVGVSGDTGTVTWTSASPSWSSSSISGAKYILIYDATATNHDLIGFMDLETTLPGGVSDFNGTFTVNWNASGIWSLA